MVAPGGSELRVRPLLGTAGDVEGPQKRRGAPAPHRCDKLGEGVVASRGPDANSRSAKAGSRRAKKLEPVCPRTPPKMRPAGDTGRRASWARAAAKVAESHHWHLVTRCKLLGERGRHSVQRVLHARCSSKGQQ